ncbi:ATP-binding protein [Streptomyces sp. NPDC006172]|uniref:ATP-binding protein n=1 Tax=Streptomyces sp. NPDC006172 TaxID=3154470 RepID=UPI003400FFF8
MDPAADRLGQPFTAATARDHVRRLLRTRAAPPSSTVVDDALLVVTELVTNAVRHGGGLTGFDARLAGDALTVSVSDASPALPHTVPRDDPAAPGGFGWPLVNRLSRQVTVTPRAGGKTVSVVLCAGLRG